MKTLLLAEYTLPKDESRMKKFVEFAGKYYDQFLGSFPKLPVSWADNTGYVGILFEFESAAAMAKVLDDDKYHQLVGGLAQLVDNFSIRLCRPGVKPG